MSEYGSELQQAVRINPMLARQGAKQTVNPRVAQLMEATGSALLGETPGEVAFNAAMLPMSVPRRAVTMGLSAALGSGDADAMLAQVGKFGMAVPKRLQKAYEYAKQLAKEGKTSQQVFDETGLARGPTGEIETIHQPGKIFMPQGSEARTMREVMPEARTALAEIPGFGDSRVRSVDLGDTLGEMRTWKPPRILVNSKLAGTPQANEVLLHEGNHAVDSLRGREVGTNPDTQLERLGELIQFLRKGTDTKAGARELGLNDSGTILAKYLRGNLDVGNAPEIAKNAYYRNLGELRAETMAQMLGKGQTTNPYQHEVMFKRLGLKPGQEVGMGADPFSRIVDINSPMLAKDFESVIPQILQKDK